MYNVILVDDERIILEGIANVIDWEHCGTRLAGKAVNGKKALELIEQQQPHIVITDVKMPEMNGIELIKAAKSRYPNLYFIILSGHEEFSFAQIAMQYGVRHYLLKPCSEDKITQVLREVVEELRESDQKETFLRNMKASTAVILPRMKEQFLKDCIINKTYGPKEWDYYSQLLNLHLADTSVRLLLFQIEGLHEFEHMYAIDNIATEIIEQAGRKIHLSTTIGDHVLLLVDEWTLESWLQIIPSIKEVYTKYYRMDFTVAVSDNGDIQQIRRLYHETKECLSYRFYLGEGSVITFQDIRSEGGLAGEIVLNDERLTLSLRSGNKSETRAALSDFFDQLRLSNLTVSEVNSHVREAYLLIVRQAGTKEMDFYLKRMIQFDQLHTLDQLEDFITVVAEEVASKNYNSNTNSHSALIQRVIQYVQDHLHDEELSLTRLANEIIHLNCDYLGKLFRKETGEKFTNYLMNARMEEAQRLMEDTGGMRISDIAAKVGFGNNPQYFSQVFKRYTGYTPTDYKRLS